MYNYIFSYSNSHYTNEKCHKNKIKVLVIMFKRPTREEGGGGRESLTGTSARIGEDIYRGGGII